MDIVSNSTYIQVNINKLDYLNNKNNFVEKFRNIISNSRLHININFDKEKLYLIISNILDLYFFKKFESCLVKIYYNNEYIEYLEMSAYCKTFKFMVRSRLGLYYILVSSIRLSQRFNDAIIKFCVITPNFSISKSGSIVPSYNNILDICNLNDVLNFEYLEKVTKPIWTTEARYPYELEENLFMLKSENKV